MVANQQMLLDTRQIRTLLLVLAASVTAIAFIWFAFLRTEYVPVYQNIREADASAIIAELDQAGIPYRLANEGHDIQVPEDMAADARVAVAGSEISVGGTVGFELFNESDMGLTEFAQKINFQRAMQGELSRTIMMMDGVEFARVHLAIPERSIFRASQGTPTAAVTIEMEPGARLTSQRIGGIQQLVASSVPDLTTFDVAVLNDTGDLVSASLAVLSSGSSAPVTEKAALENFYAVKARKAIEAVLPGMPFDVEITARNLGLGNGLESEVSAATSGARITPERNDLALRLLVRTPHTLGKEERDIIQSVLTGEFDLDERRGDVLTFTTGALNQALTSAVPAIAADSVASLDTATDAQSESWSDEIGTVFPSKLTLIGLVLLAIATYAAWPRRRLAKEEAASFAEMLKSAAAMRGHPTDA